MSSTNEDLQESSKQSQPEFSAILTPYRSLSQHGFLALMILIGGVNFVGGVFFYLSGAWPVVGFLGLDVLLVYVAFRMNYRSGKMYETVDLVDDELVITRVQPSGKSQSWSFNPYWVKLIVERKHDETTRLILSSHEKKLVFGSFLLNDEKLEFAEALKTALFEYRGGTRI